MKKLNKKLLPILLTSVFGLSACSSSLAPPTSTGSAVDRSFRGKPTGYCMIPGDYVEAWFSGGIEVHRNVYKDGYTALGKCGQKGRTVGRCFTVVTSAVPDYDRVDGHYKGSIPVWDRSRGFACPTGWSGVNFFPVR